MENPPAFPTGHSCEIERGMSLRDYFAAKAMQSLLSSPHQIPSGTTAEELVAKAAYLVADEMLKLRESTFDR